MVESEVGRLREIGHSEGMCKVILRGLNPDSSTRPNCDEILQLLSTSIDTSAVSDGESDSDAREAWEERRLAEDVAELETTLHTIHALSWGTPPTLPHTPASRPEMVLSGWGTVPQTPNTNPAFSPAPSHMLPCARRVGNAEEFFMGSPFHRPASIPPAARKKSISSAIASTMSPVSACISPKSSTGGAPTMASARRLFS